MRSRTCTVFVLNYKTYNLTASLLNDLFLQRAISFNVIVIDNDCEENEQFMALKNQFLNRSNVFFISTGSNIGYAQGNNFGINWACHKGLIGDFIVILNNDIEFTDENTLSFLIEELMNIKDAAVISPKIILKRNELIQGPYSFKSCKEYVFEALFPFYIPIRIYFQQKKIQKIKSVKKVYRTMGSFLVIKAKIFEKIGWFDPNTFLGSEEDIIAYKVNRLGYSYYYLPSIFVYHESGASSSKLQSKFVENEFLKSELYFFKEYVIYNRFQLVIVKYSIMFRNICKHILCRS